MVEKALFKYCMGFVTALLVINAFIMLTISKNDYLSDVYIVILLVLAYVCIIILKYNRKEQSEFIFSLPVKKDKQWNSIVLAGIVLVVLAYIEYFISVFIQKDTMITYKDIIFMFIPRVLIAVICLLFMLWFFFHGFKVMGFLLELFVLFINCTLCRHFERFFLGVCGYNGKTFSTFLEEKWKLLLIPNKEIVQDISANSNNYYSPRISQSERLTALFFCIIIFLLISLVLYLIGKRIYIKYELSKDITNQTSFAPALIGVLLITAGIFLATTYCFGMETGYFRTDSSYGDVGGYYYGNGLEKIVINTKEVEYSYFSNEIITSCEINNTVLQKKLFGACAATIPGILIWIYKAKKQHGGAE